MAVHFPLVCLGWADVVGTAGVTSEDEIGGFPRVLKARRRRSLQEISLVEPMLKLPFLFSTEGAKEIW